jgi:hypothetical protein
VVARLCSRKPKRLTHNTHSGPAPALRRQEQDVEAGSGKTAGEPRRGGDLLSPLRTAASFWSFGWPAPDGGKRVSRSLECIFLVTAQPWRACDSHKSRPLACAGLRIPSFPACVVGAYLRWIAVNIRAFEISGLPERSIGCVGGAEKPRPTPGLWRAG